jgi:hypothetical protein
VPGRRKSTHVKKNPCVQLSSAIDNAQNFAAPLQGARRFLDTFPGLPPWAILFGPYGAGKGWARFPNLLWLSPEWSFEKGFMNNAGLARQTRSEGAARSLHPACTRSA